MNSIQDPSKKTSINSLLNPEASSAAFTNQLPNLVASLTQNQVQSHDHPVDVYASSFVNGSSFNLRAADWDTGGNVGKKNPENGTRHYHGEAYAEQHAPRIARRVEDTSAGGYPPNGQVWQPQQNNMSYGAPAVAAVYSDERTALSGDYHPHNHYNTGYQDQPSSAAAPQAWQNTERVSLRLATREYNQDNRYAPTYYYDEQSPYQSSHPPQHSQPQQQPTARQIQPPPSKRRSSDADETPPKAKRTKTKGKMVAGDGTPGPSKRGYNAKKRSEAAQIAAQNAQLVPTVSYTQVPTDKGKEKASDERMQIVTADDNQSGGGDPLHPELQFARCMSNRYKSDQFPRCVSCTRRWAGDTCRFQGIRFFLKDAQRNIVGISFVESQKADSPTMNFPSVWNMDLKSEHIKRTKRTVAQALLPTLQKELDHLGMSEIIRRPRESEVRTTCDTCMTSIFSSSWMCRLCGREACAECFSQVKDLTVDRPGADHAEIAALQLRRERHAYSNPFFLSCTRRNEHQAKDFSPMSRFCKKELARAIEDMQKLLKEESVDEPLGKLNAGELTPPQMTEYPSTGSSAYNTDRPLHPSKEAEVLITASSIPPPYVPPNLSQIILDTPTRPIRRFTDDALTPETFPAIWALGEPLVVTGLLHKFKIQWTPEYFIEKYGSQSCLIIECQTEVNKRITVGQFFSDFAKYPDRVDCWKLKDWPPSTDFKTAFPELYEDFSQAVPVPNYVRRDGVLNIASHFPSNTIAPDLGPKMYNAMAATQAAGSKGSTRLHMDMADALNIMTYASPCLDGSPGCAAWDLFRAEDSDEIRIFLKNRFKPGNTANGNGNAAGSNGNGQKARTNRTHEWNGIHDPIHGQQFYLDEELRAALWEEHRVMSYRVYQRPGDAVFIPAGCAHQVANMADCIKVAVDFVSPENIERCERLTKEFREQNQRKVWKEDVLQLRTMMWFAWLSCCHQESAGMECQEEEA